MQNKKSLTQNALLSSIKTLSTIVFPMITYPYITRVLSVENIGKVNFGNSVVSYFSLIGALGLTGYAVRTGAKFKDDKAKLSGFSSSIFTINVLASLIAYGLMAICLLFPTKLADYRSIILIQATTILFAPLAVEWLYTIEEDFAYITLRSILVQFCSLILMFIFVKNEDDIYKYVLLCVVSSSLGNLFNFAHSKKYTRIRLTRKTDWCSSYKSIITFFVNSIATVIYLNSDTTMLGLMCNDYAVGLYSVATKIYSIIKQVFNAVVGVTIPRLSYLNTTNQQDFDKLVRRMISLTIVGAVPASFGMILLRKEIILLISGEAYISAATALAILAVAICFGVLSNIIANGVLVCVGHEKKVLIATSASAAINVLLNSVCIPLLKQNGAALTTLIAELTMFLVSIHHARKYITNMFDLHTVLSVAISCALMFAAGEFTRSYLVEYSFIVRIAVVIPICVFVYLLSLILTREPFVCGVVSEFRTKGFKK